jgi:hypothetical protein
MLLAIELAFCFKRTIGIGKTAQELCVRSTSSGGIPDDRDRGQMIAVRVFRRENGKTERRFFDELNKKDGTRFDFGGGWGRGRFRLLV